MKKRLLALMLVVAMVMGMSMTTFAEPGVDEGSFKKTYTVTGGTTVPTEVIKFDVKNETTGTVPTLKVDDDNEFPVTGGETKEYTIPFKVSLNGASAGTYRYTISEVAGETQGVTYAEEKIGVEVLVTLKDGKTPTITEIGVAKADKETKFTNKYDLGSLAISKKVTGNLGNVDKYFDVTVTFNAPKTVNSDITISGGTHEDNDKLIAKDWTGSKTVTVKIKDDETITFGNIPAGVTYTVKEANYTGDGKNSENGYDPAKYSLNGATASVMENGASDNIVKGDTDTVEITNHKDATIATGLIINNFPYILALAAVALVAVAFMRKRRSF